MKRDKEHFRGCLLGGAVGDALGAPVEFLSLEEIKNKFGAAGVTSLPKRPGRKSVITDDTQMTLFTAEGLLRAVTRQLERGLCYPPSVVHHAITGNILGAYLGQQAIPQDWLYNLELTEEIIQIADDLLIQYRNDDEWRQKYPGW